MTTCVSAYYPVKNKHGDKYLEWFQNTLSIHCPYVIFTTQYQIPLLQSFRKELPTHFVECDFTEFETYQYKDVMQVHPVHCPSIQLNLIWNEKVFFMQRASIMNPFCSEWFIWVDAGICVYRDTPPPCRPFPDPAKMRRLPQDKFIYSSSQPYRPNDVSPTRYYHHVSGGVFVMHQQMMDDFVSLYKEFLDACKMNSNCIWTEQVVLTHIFKDNPEMFHRLVDGYGAIITKLH